MRVSGFFVVLHEALLYHSPIVIIQSSSTQSDNKCLHTVFISRFRYTYSHSEFPSKPNLQIKGLQVIIQYNANPYWTMHLHVTKLLEYNLCVLLCLPPVLPLIPKFTLKGWHSTSSTNGCCKQQTCLFAVHLFYVRKPIFIVKCTVCRVSLMAIAAAQLSGDLCASHCQLQKFKSSSFKWIMFYP